MLNYFLSLLLVALISSVSQVGYSQYGNPHTSLEDDYDRRERILEPFEEDDEKYQKRKYQEYLYKIQKGDPTILRLILYESFQNIHDKIVEEERETGKSYFDIIGGAQALPSYFGCLENQDPKVRLKCIGFLGHWVEDIGKNLKSIESAVDMKLSSNIETRKEVRYAYRVLKMKIVRKRVLEAIKNGDQKVLVNITPEEFLPLVHYEPRLRTIYLGSSSSLKIRSIVLDPGIEPETGKFVGDNPGRAPKSDIEQICYLSPSLSYGQNSEVMQASLDDKSRNKNSKGKDSSVIVQNRPVIDKASLNWPCVRSIYTGIDNKSQFIREHSARIFLNYVRGYTGDTYYLGDTAGKSRVLAEELEKMAKNAYYSRLAQVAWDNIKWSEFSYEDRVMSPSDINQYAKQRYYTEYESQSRPSMVANTSRYFTENVKSFPEWGTEVTGNYRNDIKEILRIFGLSWYLDPEYVAVDSLEGDYRKQTRVSTLFERDSREDRLEGDSYMNIPPGGQQK